MNKLTEYLDIPLTQALAQSFGAKLEQLTAIDKLDAAQAILTAIAWGDIEQTHKPITATMEEFGAVFPMPRTPTPLLRSLRPIAYRSKTV